MKRARLAALVVAGSALLASVACSSSGRQSSGEATPVDGVVAVSAFEWGFTPEKITVTAGEGVRIEFSNDGNALHNLVVDGLETADGDNPFVEAKSGEADSVAFTPVETGEFEFYCTISGHRRRGMEGTLVVS